MNPAVFSANKAPRPEYSTTRLMAEVTIATVGVALVSAALAANQHWLDRHFLPSFFLPRRWYVPIETVVRVVFAVAGLSLAVAVRRRLARVVARAPRTALSAAST